MARRGEPIPESVRRQVRARSGGQCEAAIQAVCAYTASDIHHRKSRARGGSNDLKNLLHVCRACHRNLEEHRPRTECFRTHSWDDEGVGEDGSVWQPFDRSKP